MSTLVDSATIRKQPWSWVAIAIATALVLAAITIPNLMRSRGAADFARLQASQAEPTDSQYYSPTPKTRTVAVARNQPAMSTVAEHSAGSPAPDASGDRKIIRSSSLAIVVQHPAQVMDRIMALAEMEGGYLEHSQGGGQDAASGSLTIRVPAARFEATRAEIRKLGVRVESETITAQDVTRQYVDQDANLRNLRAEEAQYLAILKRANTVKDLLAVGEELSRVRGQIEQQQAEFNALSKQIETVAIAISLRTEAEAHVFGLNWRPLYQAKLALRDGLESVARYAFAMTAFLFYLPAVLLWVGTIALGIWLGWRTVLWAGRKFGWNTEAAASQK